MGTTLERSIAYQINDQEELERLYLELVERFEKHRIEIINGRIVVREMPTIAHANIVYQLMAQLMPFSMEKGWRIYPEARLLLQVQADRFEPDLIVVPPNPASGIPATSTRTPRCSSQRSSPRAAFTMTMWSSRGPARSREFRSTW